MKKFALLSKNFFANEHCSDEIFLFNVKKLSDIIYDIANKYKLFVESPKYNWWQICFVWYNFGNAATFDISTKD